MIEYTYQEKIVARLLISLNKALTRPEILPYMKEQILRNTQTGMKDVSDDKITEFLIKASE